MVRSPLAATCGRTLLARIRGEGVELKPSKVYLAVIMNDIGDYHSRRMGSISADALNELVVEKQKTCPDTVRIEALNAIIQKAQRDRGDVSVTIRDVINPMRAELGMVPLSEDAFGPEHQQDDDCSESSGS